LAAVVIGFDETFAQVSNGATTVSDDQLNTQGTVAAKTLPGYSSTTTSLYNSAGLSGIFAQSRVGNFLGFAYGFARVDFSTSVNVPYTATGGFSNSAGFTVLQNYLFDFSTSTYLYYSEQDSVGAPAAFTLGGTAGNYYNSFSGSLTGTLLVGHSYQWYGVGYTYASPVADGGAAASGGVSLTLGSVPEQSSLIVWSLLALTIGGACWWKRSRLAA
jgi:hypothetical protein